MSLDCRRIPGTTRTILFIGWKGTMSAASTAAVAPITEIACGEHQQTRLRVNIAGLAFALSSIMCPLGLSRNWHVGFLTQRAEIPQEMSARLNAV